jgi:hypothetical protein
MPMPLMPSTGGIASPSPGPMAGPTAGGPDAGGLAGLMGGSPSPALQDPQAQMQMLQQSMMQFDQIASQITDLARTFPGHDSVVQQIIQGLDQFRSEVAVSMSPSSAMMPGASQMM